MKRILFLPVLALLTNPALAEVAPEFDCLIEPHTVVDVNTSVQGKIDAIHVHKSDLVEQDQLLIELESDVEKATVELAAARVDMDAKLRTRRVSHAFAKRKLGRFDEMYKDDVVPLHTKDEVETEATLAALQLREAKEQMTLAGLELKRAQALLDQRIVKSPITGVVVDRFKSPGEFVEDEPILRLAQLDPLNVEVILPSSMFGMIESGMQAKVHPEETEEAGTHEATVTIVDRVIDASSGTFGVRLELPNPDYKLPGGLRCSVKFLSKNNKMNASSGTSSLVLKD